ncbi:MAG: FeoA family protein [Steroidobacteraceae bacterium]
MVAVLKSWVDPATQYGVPLTELRSGVEARVVCIQGADDAAGHELALRLSELGFLPGERVRIVARGFLTGEPLAVRVGTGTFALRRFEAAVIRVEPEGPLRG